ncbi:MAG: diaminopimelate epimerase [Bacteroidetes bacterium GWF2_38_335]|nr:MAG: diaminopimelate epimerase [Bacteroidetes bacterium GWF2_38_335]OFY77780.1 MAG: diaminopimelate epimerase [Bacteroidetes bacterium RIFOXYA12_FULL_38_20]HBS87416.1 diaminopimelate epimerase [Bacteroidales bacterium]
MTISFTKYHGAGNDFVLIDNRSGIFDSSNSSLVKQLCDRRFGIGGDGLMLLNSSKSQDFEMKYYNSDGHEGTMCGNGGRCIVAFAKKLGIIGNETNFLAVDGPHYAKMSDNLVSLKMNDVSEIKKIGNNYFVNTGSPHYIEFVENVKSIDVVSLGRKIRNRSEFAPGGTNVNFVSYSKEQIEIRTYERGVEDETYSCGTGTVAAALVISEAVHPGINELSLQAPGGILKVSFEKTKHGYRNIMLTGPAAEVFTGVVTI